MESKGKFGNKFAKRRFIKKRSRKNEHAFSSMGIPIGRLKHPDVTMKYADTPNNAQQVSSLGNLAVVCLNDQQQGTNSAARTSNRTRQMYVDIRYSIVSASTQVLDQNVRVFIITDNQCNAAVISASAMFSYPTNMVVTQYNPLNAGRYLVHYDECHRIPFYGNSCVDVFKRVKLGNRVVYNNTNGGSYADIDRGSVWLCYTSDTPTASATTAPFLSYDIRVWFMDD